MKDALGFYGCEGCMGGWMRTLFYSRRGMEGNEVLLSPSTNKTLCRFFGGLGREEGLRVLGQASVERQAGRHTHCSRIQPALIYIYIRGHTLWNMDRFRATTKLDAMARRCDIHRGRGTKHVYVLSLVDGAVRRLCGVVRSHGEGRVERLHAILFFAFLRGKSE